MHQITRIAVFTFVMLFSAIGLMLTLDMLGVYRSMGTLGMLICILAGAIVGGIVKGLFLSNLRVETDDNK